MRFIHVTAKLGKMRKPQEFVVQPTSTPDHVIVQSDKSIGRFNFRTGKGVLNTHGAYFPHLAVAEPFDFPAEFVTAVLEACPSLDGQTTIGHVTIMHTVQEF